MAAIIQAFISLQVCELDIIFNFEKAYFMLDELLISGEIQETSKKNVLKAIAAQDMLQEVRMVMVTLDVCSHGDSKVVRETSLRKSAGDT